MRSAEVVRDTLETKITVAINLDGTGVSQFNTGLSRRIQARWPTA
jgi:imidazoleglycerol-phosphate dehydratase